MTTRGPAPGFVDRPEHYVHITLSNSRWTVRDGDVLLADSRRALLLDEQGYEQVIYIPPEDVSTQRLTQPEHRTTCPFKGEAGYFVHTNSESQQLVAWTYPAVFDEVAAIEGYIAFYADHVQIREELTDGD